MAIFKKRVEVMSGLTITDRVAETAPEGARDYTAQSDINGDQLNIVLKDGVLDITEKSIASDPKSAISFARETAGMNTNSKGIVYGATILSVVREDGVTTDAWRNCNYIPYGMAARALDTTSIHYASAYNPAYTIIDNTVNVYPIPGGTPNLFKVFYINNDIDIKWNYDEDESAEDSEGRLLYFPRQKVHLIIIYASFRMLEYKLSELHRNIPLHSSDLEINDGWARVKEMIDTEEDIELATAKIGSLTSEMQQFISEYQWYQQRAQMLKQEYVTAFAISNKPSDKRES